MLPGHIALGTAIASFFPDTGVAPAIFGACFHDLTWGVLLLLKVEHIEPDRAHSGPYIFFNLTGIDLTHSLLTSTLLTLAWAGLFAPRGRDAATAGLLAGASHILSDWATHNRDMPLYPGSSEHFGCAMYRKLGVWEWVFEGVFTFALTYLAQVQFNKRGVSVKPAWVILVAMVLNMSPWASPLWYVAGLRQPLAQQVAGALTVLSLGGPCVYLTYHFNKSLGKRTLLKKLTE
jgi:membrane-bound metal-dependent hydrolase YbcI (DUF457 family)